VVYSSFSLEDIIEEEVVNTVASSTAVRAVSIELYSD
jgi:hypothetical protein